MNTEFFFDLFFSGLTRGSIYALLALGYTMVYGIVKLINFAHGEIYMIGAFTALIMTSVFTILKMPVGAMVALVTLIATVWSAMYGSGWVGGEKRGMSRQGDAAKVYMIPEAMWQTMWGICANGLVLFVFEATT